MARCFYPAFRSSLIFSVAYFSCVSIFYMYVLIFLCLAFTSRIA